MFYIYLPHKHKVGTVGQITCKPSSYTSVDIHIPPLPSDITDTPATIIQELHPETAPPTKETTTPVMQQTLPGSYPRMPVQFRHPPLIEVPSAPTNIHAYVEVSDDELESCPNSVTTDTIAGPLTTPHNSSHSIPCVLT